MEKKAPTKNAADTKEAAQTPSITPDVKAEKPSNSELKELIKSKIAAGLKPAQAEECAKAQIAFDASQK